MAAQRADAHAQAIDRDHAAGIQNLVGFRLTFPLFTALAVVELLVDPRDQAAGQRHAEVIGRQFAAAGGFSNLALDIQNGGSRVLQLFRHVGMQHAHLSQQFAHVARAAAGGRLVGGDRRPFHQIVGEQAAERHQHQADGAVAANEGFDALVQALLNHRVVDRIQDDDGVVLHAQRRGRVDPVTLPTARAQLRIHFVGIIAALTGNNDIERAQCVDVIRILQRALLAAEGRRGRTVLRGGEKDRANGVEIALFRHALHENRADHSAPTDETNVFHNICVPPG